MRNLTALIRLNFFVTAQTQDAVLVILVLGG